ncbi:MAG TPA: HAMP domain-containing histidine kinase [Planctomycetes bacterium]|nr:HAMP domain-containing histidine kinase [Planctomycetota bacterium]
MSLRTRLLLGLSLAVAVPLLAFWVLGDHEIRRRTRENLIVHLLRGLARETSERLREQLLTSRGIAELFSVDDHTRALLRTGGRGRGNFESWFLRVAGRLVPTGSFVLFDAEGRPLFLAVDGAPGGTLREGAFPAPWFSSDPELLGPRFAPVRVSPFVSEEAGSSSRDPSRLVLPLRIPILEDDMRLLGFGVYFLPLGNLQADLERTRKVFVQEMGVKSAQVFLFLSGSGEGRILLHTDRGRIGARLDPPLALGFTKRGKRIYGVEALSPDAARPAPEFGADPLFWRVGVVADEDEIFQSVDALGSFFWILLAGILATTLGMASLISWMATRSLRGLESLAAELGEGHLDVRAKEEGPQEVRSLASSLNRMATRLEQDRERLRAAERDRAWTKMARQVAHEIKNPLQPLRLHAELIQRSEAAPQAKESAGTILRQVASLQRIVEDFQEFARASEPLDMSQEFAPGELLEELRALYGADPGLRLEIEEDGSCPDLRLRGDPQRLQQVLINALKNAIEASGPEPEIRILSRVQKEESPRAGLQEPRPREERGGEGPKASSLRWILEIQDRGCGVEGLDPDALFEPYFSTKRGGTGLGLALARRHIEAAGGRITLGPRSGGGAVLRIELPAFRSGERAP